jgi:hypothetical protein
VFVKSDGKCACAFYSPNFLTWQNAVDECQSFGARLPEIKSAKENFDIYSVSVSTIQNQYQIFGEKKL